MSNGLNGSLSVQADQVAEHYRICCEVGAESRP